MSDTKPVWFRNVPLDQVRARAQILRIEQAGDRYLDETIIRNVPVAVRKREPAHLAQQMHGLARDRPH